MKNFVFCWVISNTGGMSLQAPVVLCQFTVAEGFNPDYLGDDGFPTREVMLIERGLVKSTSQALKVQMAEFTDEEIEKYTLDDQPSQEMKDMFSKKYLERGRNRHVFNAN